MSHPRKHHDQMENRNAGNLMSYVWDEICAMTWVDCLDEERGTVGCAKTSVGEVELSYVCR